MNCTETRTLLSSYLDGAVTGKQMRDAETHLAACSECNRQFLLLQQTQRLVSGLGRRKAPPKLALQLRVALSQEAARARRPLWAGFGTRVENAFNMFLMPVTAGALSAIVIFGLLIGYFAVPASVQAADYDVPTSLYTPAELKFSPFELGMGTINADSIVVEVHIDPNGRVQDYKIISGPKDTENLLPQLSNMLIFTVFRPATAFGQPTTGKAVLSFSKINVKG